MNLPIPRCSDSLVLAKFAKIGARMAQRNWRLTAIGDSAQLFEVTVAKDAEPWNSNPVALEMSKGSGISTRSFSFAVDGTTYATVQRQDGQPQDNLTIQQQWFGTDSEDTRLRYARASDAVGAEFVVSRASSATVVSSTGELAQFVESRDQALARLEELYLKFARGMLEDRQRAETDLGERKRKLEEDATNIRAGLNAERDALAKSIAEEREALAARLKEVDDRAATVARRQIRQDLKQEFKSRQAAFGVTADTQMKRVPVARTLIILAFCLGIVFLFYVGDFVVHPPSSDVMVVAIIRQILLGLGFGGTVWFYIHWENAWFQRHAEEEFRLKRLELDFDRASWVVELAMEWSKEKTGQEVPETVLRELTRGLFAESTSTSPSPRKDVFSALLDASTKAEIAVGGSKFSLNHKGGKRLKEALSSEE